MTSLISREVLNIERNIQMEIVIDNEVSVPVSSGKRGGGARKGKSKYPLAALEVGQSFWVTRKFEKSLRGTASRYKRQNPGWNYCVRIEDTADIAGVPERGVRVWRTA